MRTTFFQNFLRNRTTWETRHKCGDNIEINIKEIGGEDMNWTELTAWLNRVLL